MSGTSTPQGHEGLIVMLARLDPGRQPDIHNEVRDSIAGAFQREDIDAEPEVADFGCLGRYDAIYIVRAPTLAFLPVAQVPHVHGLKKLDVQYGYARDEEARAFWTAWRQKRTRPLLLLAYLRIRDDYTFATGGDVHEAGARPLVAGALNDAGFPVRLLVRALGWPDYIVLACSDDLHHITRFAQSQLWNMPTSRLPREQLGILKEKVQGNDTASIEYEPVFSRSYTLIGYPCDVDFSTVSGDLTSAQVDLRLRPGGDSAAHQVFLAAGKDAKDFQASFALQLGSEDAALWLRPKPWPWWRRKRIRASSLLTWYQQHLFVPPEEPGPPDLPPPNSLITTSEMRLGIPLTELPAVTPMLASYAVMEPVKPPPDFLDYAKGKGMLLVQPVAMSLTSMCRMINWAVVNEGIQRDFWDLYHHTRAFLKFVQRSLELEGRQAGPQLLDDIRLNTRLFSEAFSQRLTGSYYDLGADSPEVLIEYPGGIQKLIAAFYAVQSSLFTRVATELKLATIQPCCIVSKEAETAECVRSGSAFTLRLCSSLAFEPRAAAYPLAHELGHMLRHLYVSYLNVPRDKRPSGDYLWAKWDPQTSRFWFEPQLDRLQQWAAAPAPWGAQSLLLGGDVLEEVFAETVGFLLMEADFESYAAAIRRFVPRVPDPLPLVIICWVTTQLSHALEQHGWPADAGGRSLLDFLARQGPVDVRPFLPQSTGGRPPAGAAGTDRQQAEVCEDLFARGWQQVADYGMISGVFAECLAAGVDYAQALLIWLERKTQGAYRTKINSFRQLAGDGSFVLDPLALESLWRAAMGYMAALRQQLPVRAL